MIILLIFLNKLTVLGPGHTLSEHIRNNVGNLTTLTGHGNVVPLKPMDAFMLQVILRARHGGNLELSGLRFFNIMQSPHPGISYFCMQFIERRYNCTKVTKELCSLCCLSASYTVFTAQMSTIFLFGMTISYF